MADLSNLIYIAALSNPQQSGGAAGAPARQAGSARRLAPLLAILALSLIPLSMSVFVSHMPATHEPIPNLVYSNAPPRPARPAECYVRIAAIGRQGNTRCGRMNGTCARPAASISLLRMYRPDLHARRV